MFHLYGFKAIFAQAWCPNRPFYKYMIDLVCGTHTKDKNEF